MVYSYSKNLDTHQIMSYIVAVTGGIGSGKSTVANIFLRHGIVIIDADVIARKVVSAGSLTLEKIVQRFGKQILLGSGELNRRALREKIFNQPHEKTWLNECLHPLIRHETELQLTQTRDPYALWVVPLLVENNLQDYADRVLVIDVSIEIQLARTIARDGISFQEVKTILSAQATREQRIACADDVINNSGNETEIEALVSELHQQYLKLSRYQSLGRGSGSHPH